MGITSDTMDITNSKEVSDLISSAKSKEVYFLAAFHHSSEEDINKVLNCLAKVLIFTLLPRLIFLMKLHSILPKAVFSMHRPA